MREKQGELAQAAQVGFWKRRVVSRKGLNVCVCVCLWGGKGGGEAS